MPPASSNFWSLLPRPILALAPMEGLTDSAFRQLARSFGADVVYTEFVSADALRYRSRTALAKLSFAPTERPVICQLFGRDPQSFSQAARLVEKSGFSGIDVNFGCPAKKVVRHGSGVALLRDPAYARRLVETVLESTNLPVSIKVRASIRRERREVNPLCPERVTALDLVAALADLPVSAIMVHGRSYENGFAGPIDAGMIRQVKANFHGLVLANGGVIDATSAISLLQETKADGLGIARGALGSPWIFSQIRAQIAGGLYPNPDWKTLIQIMKDHASLAEAAKGQRGLLELRKHLAWYISGFSGAADLRRQLVRINSQAELADILNQFPYPA